MRPPEPDPLCVDIINVWPLMALFWYVIGVLDKGTIEANNNN